MTKASKLGR